MSTVTSATEGLLSAYRRHLSRGRALFGQVTGGLAEVSSGGVWVRTVDGRSLLDAGGYGVFLLGHRHPVVVEAVQAQLQTHPMATRTLLDPVCARASTLLAGVAPADIEHVHWVTSGAEATETALKLARINGHRRVIAMAGGFHGKTLGALSVTSRPTFRDPFLPLLPVTHVPYGDAEALASALASEPDPACVVVEPVLGEAGVIVPPIGYLARVQQVCRDAGAMLVLDEIQTGLGRTGRWWGGDHDGLTPDMVLVGKVLSGGVIPAAAVLATDAAYAPFDRDPFLHSSTFAGAPLACAAAAATIEVIAGEGLVERAEDLGARLLSAVCEIFRDHLAPVTREVRGRGLMIGVEFDSPGVVGDLVLTLLEEGLLVSTSLNEDRVLRLTPPAVLTDGEVEQLLQRLSRGCARVASRLPSTPRQPDRLGVERVPVPVPSSGPRADITRRA